MTAKECIKGRRSIRKFTGQPIDRSLLAEIIETASYSPSWKNTQIARYIAVEGELKDRIADECTSAYPNNGSIIKGAPMLIVITFIKNRCGYERDGSFTTAKGASWQMFDAGIASQSFCLAAYEQGIGSVIQGIFDDEKVGQLLNLPEDREVAALIPIGYPAEEPAAPRRKPVDDLLSYM